MSRDVWELDVFRRAYHASLEVHRLCAGFPKIEQYGGLADQLRRSSKSVCALLAEGAGRQLGSDVEFRRYVIMALGSVEETKLWCRYAVDLGYLDRVTAAPLQSHYQDVGRMLGGLHKHLSND